jgi:hypothetical protein
MIVTIPTGEAFLGKVNIAFELISGRIMHGAEMSHNLGVSEASKLASVSVTFCGWDFRIKYVNRAVRSLK